MQNMKINKGSSFTNAINWGIQSYYKATTRCLFQNEHGRHFMMGFSIQSWYMSATWEGLWKAPFCEQITEDIPAAAEERYLAEGTPEIL